MWDIFEEIEKVMVEEAREEGEKNGERKGEDKLNQLYSLLLQANKIDELKKSMNDKAYRKRLYKKYQIR